MEEANALAATLDLGAVSDRKVVPAPDTPPCIQSAGRHINASKT
jgi:hypothetical protein